MTVNGTEYAIRPGRVSLVLPGAEVRYRYRGPSPHLYVPLRLGSDGAPRTVPVVQHAGPDLTLLTTALQRALAAWPNTPARAAAEVWAARPVAGLPARPSEGAEHAGRSSGGRSRRGPHRGAAGSATDRTGDRGGSRSLPQPPDVAPPRREGGDGRRLYPGPANGTGPPLPAGHHALRPRRRLIGRHSGPTGVQQGLSPRTRNVSAQHPCRPAHVAPLPRPVSGPPRHRRGCPQDPPGALPLRRQPFRIPRRPRSAPRLELSNGPTCRLHGRPRGSAGVDTG